MKFFIHLLCIFAVMSATISPACAFISGKSGTWIEICSGMNITKVQVADDKIPDITAQGCEFCFQHYNMSAVDVDAFSLKMISLEKLFQNFQTEVALIHFYQSYPSRAPPIFS